MIPLLFFACSPEINDCDRACAVLYSECEPGAYSWDDALSGCKEECRLAGGAGAWGECVLAHEAAETLTYEDCYDAMLGTGCSASPCDAGPIRMWTYDEEYACDG